MSVIGLKQPELLLVAESGEPSCGGDQYWYPKEGFIPPGACGATTASNLLAYLLRSRPELYEAARAAGLDGLAAAGALEPNNKSGYLEFMKKIYRFTYPRVGGLMADAFLEGMAELALEYGLPITTERLKAPISKAKRPDFTEAAAFIRASLEDDLPLAFLILSNGCVANLDTWHWVTILALDEDGSRVQITDNGKTFWVNLERWLDTSIMGGAFVRLSLMNS